MTLEAFPNVSHSMIPGAKKHGKKERHRCCELEQLPLVHSQQSLEGQVRSRPELGCSEVLPRRDFLSTVLTGRPRWLSTRRSYSM